MNKVYTTILASFLSFLISAQQNSMTIEGAKIDYISNRTNLPLQISFDGSKHLSDAQFTDWMKKELIGNEESSFSSVKTNFDQLGMKHNRLQQYYKGYKIEGAIILSHSKHNEVVSFTGDWFKDITLHNSIAISEQQALQAALTKVAAKKYKWENKEEEDHMKTALNNPNFSYMPVGEVVILPVISRTKTVTYQYAYKFSIYAEEPLYKANVFVDATTGAIIKEQNQICTIDAVGTANTKYSGTQTITTDSYTGGFRLRETARGNGIETYNMKNTQTYSATDFTNTANSWTITTADQAATDAHFGAEATYDFYFQTFNRNSVDDNGFKLLSYVHYSTNYVNAFWDGLRMTYGDGQVSQGFTIMTALDVCGHEITHGVVENTAGLNGGEADALNEGFADIFGTSVEWAARPAQHDWLMGKDISTTGSAIRDMSNPKSLQQPDTYMGQYWSATDEPHDNAGQCIYWFYLLSVGGNGTNDNNDAYNVSSITMAKAQAIAYRAMAYYMTPGTDYANVRACTIQAAKDLYGACSNEVIQTTNAWYAVGVGAQYAPGVIGPDFAANQSVSCSLPVTINFDNTTSAGLSFAWDFGDGATSTATTTAHTYTANGSYSVKLVATGCITGSRDSLTKTGYIVINSPLPANATDENICSNTSATLTASGNGNINWYDAATGGNLLGSGNTYATPTLTGSATYYAINSVTQAPVFGGPATNTAFGGGSNFNANADRYLIFDVLQACTLKTVKVVSGGAGNRTIELRDAAGTVLQSTVVSIPTGTQTISLNFNLTPGTNYQLGTATLPNMWRNNSGSGYPFNVGGLVSITGADAGSSYYYYFYNWEVQGADCQSAATAVTASVSICTGLNDAITENSVQLYPNPAADKLTLNLSEELAGATKSIEVYDALGKMVLIVPVTSTQTQMNVSELAKGVYTCRFVNTKNQTIVKRFVKE
jgi:Zn-dependent metalloprotease